MKKISNHWKLEKEKDPFNIIHIINQWMAKQTSE
jgi:hypothetical protein